jgi:hypothetical protein
MQVNCEGLTQLALAFTCACFAVLCIVQKRLRRDEAKAIEGSLIQLCRIDDPVRGNSFRGAPSFDALRFQ